MSDYDFDFECPECGGSDGCHYDDCTYEGTDGSYGAGGYYSRSRKAKTSSSSPVAKMWGFYIFALIIGYGINELLGTILLIGWIIYLIVSK